MEAYGDDRTYGGAPLSIHGAVGFFFFFFVSGVIVSQGMTLKHIKILIKEICDKWLQMEEISTTYLGKAKGVVFWFGFEGFSFIFSRFWFNFPSFSGQPNKYRK